MGDKFEGFKASYDEWKSSVKAEFKKVIWPDQKTVARETTAVICSGVGLALVLALLDTVIKFGLGFIL